MPGATDGFGRYLEGYLSARGVPRKVICEKAGVDASTLSKQINGVQEIPKEQALMYGEVIGAHVTRSGRSG